MGKGTPRRKARQGDDEKRHKTGVNGFREGFWISFLFNSVRQKPKKGKRRMKGS